MAPSLQHRTPPLGTRLPNPDGVPDCPAATALEPLTGSAPPLIAQFQPEGFQFKAALNTGKGQKVEGRGRVYRIAAVDR